MFSYMPYTNDTQTGFLEVDSLFFLKEQKHGVKILFYSPRITSGAVAPGNPGLLAICRINVVEADGGGPDKPYVASFQQFPVTDCPCADNQGICVFNDLRCEGFPRQIDHFICQLFDGFADVRYFVVYDYFHLYYILF